MNKGSVFFFIGLLLFMSGIYLSTKWIIIGTLIGISGGMLVGISTYVRAMADHPKKVLK